MKKATHFANGPELLRDRPPLGPIALTITKEEADGIIGFPQRGVYALMYREGKVLGGELVDGEGELPRVAASLPRYCPAETLLCVAVNGGVQKPWRRAKTQEPDSDETRVLFLPYPGWQLDNQDQALRRTLAWWGGRR